MGSNNTPPASPGIPVPDDDIMYEDDVAEIIDDSNVSIEVSLYFHTI